MRRASPSAELALEYPDDITLETIAAEDAELERRQQAGHATWQREQDAYARIHHGQGTTEDHDVVATKEAADIAWDIDCAIHNWRLAVKEGCRDAIIWTCRARILAAKEPLGGLSPTEWAEFQNAAATWLDPWDTPEANAERERRLIAEELPEAALFFQRYTPASRARALADGGAFVSVSPDEWWGKGPKSWRIWRDELIRQIAEDKRDVARQESATVSLCPPPRPAALRGNELISTRASDVQPKNVEWLWPGRIPRGKLGLLAGEQALGKTTLLLDSMARVTRAAEWPCGEGRAPLGSVIYLGTEDDAADTIVPRCQSASAIHP